MTDDTALKEAAEATTMDVVRAGFNQLCDSYAMPVEIKIRKAEASGFCTVIYHYAEKADIVVRVSLRRVINNYQEALEAFLDEVTKQVAENHNDGN